MPRSSTSRALLLAAACLLAITPFFWRGNPSGHDFEFHVYSWMEVSSQWQHGIVYPRWAALSHWGYGEARFLFYPPASWTLGGGLGAVLPWKTVPGAYCWIALMLAGAAMYGLAREWLPPSDALFAAVLYAVNPYHLLIVYWRSALAELLASALLPVLMLCLVRLKRPSPWPTLCLSLTLAAAWLTNAPAAVMIHYSAAGLVLILVIREVVVHEAVVHEVMARDWSPQAWRLLTRAAFSVVLGAGLASFYLIPATYEQGWINLADVMSPGVRPQDNFLFTTIADPEHNHFNLLVSTLAVAEIGVLVGAIWFSKKSKSQATGLFSAKLGTASARSATAGTEQSPWVLLAAWGTSSAILMFSVTNVLWQHLPKFRFVQLPFRWLLCMNAALAMLLAMATKRWYSRLLVCGFLAAAIILPGYRIQAPWWDTAADIREMRNAISDGIGYEGTDEYLPAGVDPYELNKNLPRVSDNAGASVPNKMLLWGQIQKHFQVHADAPETLTVRLFNYPAWEVTVNGKITETRTTDVTGLMVIPVDAGENDVYIYFRRTRDRLWGDVVSLMSVILFVIVAFRARLNTAQVGGGRRAILASPAA